MTTYETLRQMCIDKKDAPIGTRVALVHYLGQLFMAGELTVEEADSLTELNDRLTLGEFYDDYFALENGPMKLMPD